MTPTRPAIWLPRKVWIKNEWGLIQRGNAVLVPIFFAIAHNNQHGPSLLVLSLFWAQLRKFVVFLGHILGITPVDIHFWHPTSLPCKNMQAAFLDIPGHITLRDVPLPKPGAGEVRVKLNQVGICGSDVHLFLGHRLLNQPTVIGHEGLGIIDSLGAGVMERTVGERVIIEPNIPCRQCRYCLSGRGTICPNKRTIGLNEPGCFAEYITLPADYCWAVVDTVSDADAVTVEPMAVAVHALFLSGAKPGDTIAVIGLGAIGLLLTHLALALGYRVFVTERNADKVKIATDLGAESVSPTGESTPAEQSRMLADVWLSNDVCAVFECAGSAITASLATSAAPRGSEVVLVGLSEKPAAFTPLKVAREGIHLVPSIIYDHPFDFQRTLQLIQARVIRPGFIISSHHPIRNLQTALETAAGGLETKLVVSI